MARSTMAAELPRRGDSAWVEGGVTLCITRMWFLWSERREGEEVRIEMKEKREQKEGRKEGTGG